MNPPLPSNFFRRCPLRQVFPHTCAFLAVLIALGGFASAGAADRELFDTAVKGTLGDDTIQNNSPVNASATLSANDEVHTLLTRATGIDALGGDDSVASSAMIGAVADSDNFLSESFSMTGATAESLGIHTGDGRDSVGNDAAITSSATAEVTALEFTMLIDLGLTGHSTESVANALGVLSGLGSDSVDNNEVIWVTADATTGVGNAAISAVEVPLDAFGMGDAETTARATAIGLSSGGEADCGSSSVSCQAPGHLDVVENGGSLDAHAQASSTAGRVNVELLGAARVAGSTKATAAATGIEGSGRGDLITNDRRLRVTAISDAQFGAGELKMKGLMVKPIFDFFGLDVGKLQTVAQSDAVGTVGGDGRDEIFTIWTAEVSAVYGEATAHSTTVTLAISPPISGSKKSATAVPGALASVDLAMSAEAGGTEGAAYGDAATTALVKTVGISAGNGDDEVTSNGDLRAEAYAHAQSIGVSTDISISKKSVLPFPGVAAADTSTNAGAAAIGIDGGMGRDAIENSANLEAVALADSESTSVAAAIQGSLEGFAAGVTVADSSSSAAAHATGIHGREGGDSLSNSGGIKASATAENDAVSVSTTLAGSKVGMAFGVSVSDASTYSVAHGAGIDAGDATAGGVPEIDSVDNFGVIGSSASASAYTTSISATFAATLEGVSGGVSATKGDAVAEAFAVGILTGNGTDRILNRGLDRPGIPSIKADAVADSRSDSVAVAVSGDWKGFALGASIADATTSAVAQGVGIGSGDSSDAVTNDSDVGVSATAYAQSNSIAITAAVAPVSAGVTFSRTDTDSIATARGVSGGDGDDEIGNHDRIDVDASATTKTESIAINFALVGAGISESSSNARSSATGLDGDGGSDTLWNHGQVDVWSSARIDALSASANLAGAASGNVQTNAWSDAVGLDAGDGEGQRVENAIGRLIHVVSRAESDSRNYVVQGGGVTFAKAGTRTEATARGTAAGDGGDTFVNEGFIQTVAKSIADAFSFSFQLAGVSFGEVGIHSTGTAIGIDASDGSNRIENRVSGGIDVHAKVETLAGNVTGSLLGAGVQATGTTAGAFSTGIQSGDADDRVENNGSIVVTSSSLGQAGSGALQLLIVQDARALASADLHGVKTGGGDDDVLNRGTIRVGEVGLLPLVKGDAEAASFGLFSIELPYIGAEGRATGIAAEAGDDFVLNSGVIEVGDRQDWMAFAESFGFGSGAFVLNLVQARAEMTSVGIDGGTGADLIANEQTGTIRSRATTYAESVADVDAAFNIARARSGVDALANATGIGGGSGPDDIRNFGTIEVRVQTFGYAEADAEEVFFGNPEAISDAYVNSIAVGLDGGGGASFLLNGGLLDVLSEGWARGDSDSDADTVTTDSEASADVDATAVGIAGGDAGSAVINAGMGTIRARANARTDDPSGNITQASTDERATAAAGDWNANSQQWIPILAEAVGVSLGSAGDRVDNAGSIEAISFAYGRAHAYSNSWPHTARSEADAVAEARAKGIAAGGGRNQVANWGQLNASAWADTEPSANSWSRDQRATAISFGDSRASAIGIEADGEIHNDIAGSIQVEARATGKANSDTSAESTKATAYLSSRSTGIDTGLGTGGAAADQILNQGTIDVVATAGEDANGNRLLSAYADTSTSVTSVRAEAKGVLSADAAGMRTGANDAIVVNAGTLEVNGRAQSLVEAWAASRDYTPVAVAFSKAVSHAHGFELGKGANRVLNSGGVVVTSLADAHLRAYAEEDVGIFRDEEAHGASHSYAFAYGVLGNSGTYVVENTGSINVDARSFADLWLDTEDNDDEYRTTTSDAQAAGIQTGSNPDGIANSGAISVTVQANATYGAENASATGIHSGDGDDLISTGGTIDTSVVLGGTQTKGVAINAGDGDDRVELLPGSVSKGDVLLGTGDDSLVWGSMAVLDGIARADPGFDTFILGGDVDGVFDQSELGPQARFREFDSFRKEGVSTWTLVFDKTIDWTVDEGTLALDADNVGTVRTGGSRGALISVLPGRTVKAQGGASPVILNGGGSLFNQGRVEALNAVGDQVAVQVLGAGNSVVNEGQIEAAGVGGAQGIGIHVPGNGNRILNIGSLINSGTKGAAIALTGSGNGITNAGLIQGRMTALDIGGTRNDLYNTGDIESPGVNGQPGFGIRLFGDDGSIVNEGAVRSSAQGGAAIVLQGRRGSIVNRGSVTGERSKAVWFDSMQGAENRLVNELGGSIRSDAGPAVLGGIGNDRVENFGLLDGVGGLALDLGPGSDALLIAATSRIEGNADAGSSPDTFILGGSEDARFDLTQITKKYLGFEAFRKEGSSTWTLIGSADGPWTVATGGILLEGALFGDVLVEALGLLGGSGTAGSVRNFGTVAPGSSIGTLRVTRDYVHEPSGVLETELDGAGRSDLVNVGGKATLKGGTVKVIPLDAPGISTEYTILTAGKGVAGRFGPAYSTWNILDPYLQYEPNRVLLAVIRNDISFASFAKAANQWAVGSALDANVLDPTRKAATRGDFKRVVDEFLVLSPDEASRALDALSGELHATVQSTLLRSGDRFLSIAADRRPSADGFSSGGKRVWVDALGFRGSIDEDGNASGADYRTGGFAAGIDVPVNEDLRIGAALGYSRGDTDLDRAGAGSADIESYHFGLYGRYARGPWQLQGAAAYSRHGIETGRHIDYGSISRRAEADYDADQYSAYLRGNYDLKGPGDDLLQPFASLAYSQLDREHFRETGADSLDLDVEDETTESLYSTLGVRAAWDLSWRQARIKPELRLGWAHQFLDRNGEITANFAATPRANGYQSFKVRGAKTGRDSLVIGAGVTAEVRKNARVFVSYDGVVNGDRTEHAFLGGIRVTW